MNKLYKNIRYAVLSFCALALASSASAQFQEPGKLSLDVEVGTKIGGAAPLSMPVEIREIKSFRPAMPFFVGAKANYAIDQHWGVRAGLVLDGKGMKTEANVKGYKTTFNAAEDPSENVRGYYYGDISTNVENLYLTVPLQATYQFGEHWNVQAGPYVSFAVMKKFYGEAIEGYMRDEEPTGEKIGINNTAYDFKNSIRNVDVGMSLGGKYSFAQRYYALAQFDYGFNSIMKTGFESISFDMHNIFMNIGVGMRVF